MRPVLPSEAQLLLQATRVAGAEPDPVIAALLTHPMNWRRVGELAEQEKLLPVLWDRLRDHTAAIPPRAAERLRRGAAVSEFRMAVTESLLHDVVERLSGEGIRVMLLKGAALATTVYRSFAARPMGDLDILVRATDAERAWNSIAEAGWSREFEGGEDFYREMHHLAGLVDPQGTGIVLEIHRAILPMGGPFVLDEATLWHDARPTQLGNSEVWVLSPEHQLLHLCIHFGWPHMLHSGLARTVRDVAALLHAEHIDWSAFRKLAKATRSESCAYWTLRLATDLCDADVPEQHLGKLRPWGPRQVLNATERALAASALLGACPSIWVRQMLWRAAIRPAASGHGPARPWRVGEAFQRAFPVDGKVSLAKRAYIHLRDWRSWLRFAGILAAPRRII